MPTNDNFELPDGRKIISTSSAGVSVNLETTEQAAKGTEAKCSAAMAAIKLHCLNKGINTFPAQNAGPIVRWDYKGF